MTDPNYKYCPSDDEWDVAKRISKFLKPFYDITTLFLSTHYPIANLYFQRVWRIQLRIMEEVNQPSTMGDDLISNMAKRMKQKFVKY